MTPEEIKTLGHAFFDGKTLQYQCENGDWVDWTCSYCPGFNEGFKWRIKPDEPKKVKLACWLHRNTGNLTYRYAGVEEYAEGYVRIPELDREITLPEGE